MGVLGYKSARRKRLAQRNASGKPAKWITSGQVGFAEVCCGMAKHSLDWSRVTAQCLPTVSAADFWPEIPFEQQTPRRSAPLWQLECLRLIRSKTKRAQNTLIPIMSGAKPTRRSGRVLVVALREIIQDSVRIEGDWLASMDGLSLVHHLYTQYPEFRVRIGVEHFSGIGALVSCSYDSAKSDGSRGRILRADPPWGQLVVLNLFLSPLRLSKSTRPRHHQRLVRHPNERARTHCGIAGKHSDQRSASHTLAVLSALAVARRLPSGL